MCFEIEGASPAEHTALLEALVADNTALLGPVRIGGRPGIRACVTNHRTTSGDIDLILRRLRGVSVPAAAVTPGRAR
ncbi:hypothetical protein [Amycolatopsis saalfeldensis]|uniref:hypothetical protein n=1 Tax=Amycolatopsis saalfeldensis TaxID=394193 RepID=UPI0011604D0B|nr:hypothetical protein [Amycolatopsis saalfeldensis]